MTAITAAGDAAVRELPKVETLTWGFVPPVVAVVRARYPDLTPRELALFLYEAHRLELDPGALGQVFAILYNKDKPDKRTMAVQIGIPGFRAIAAKTGLLNGSANVEDGPEETTTYRSENGAREVRITHPVWCRATVYRKGAEFPFTATVRWSERVKIVWGVPTDFWVSQPYGQLEKCAESLALRKAFPAETRGITLVGEPEEADRSGAVDVEAVTVAQPNHAAAPPAPASLPSGPRELELVRAEIRVFMEAAPVSIRLRAVNLFNSRLDVLGLKTLNDAGVDNVPALRALLDDLDQIDLGA